MRRFGCARREALFLVCGVLAGSNAAGAPPPREGYAWELVQSVLPRVDEHVGKRFDAADFARRGTRSAVYLAAGMLWRDRAGDRDGALGIVAELLRLQYDAPPGSKRHGVWPTRANETKLDENWREFVGCGLILILEEFPGRLPEKLARDMGAALLRAARGAHRRNVGADYTNIALMSAFLMDYVGTKQSVADLRERGRAKAREIFAKFSRHKTFDEFNSPTYYGPDLMALALWRKHARSPEMRRMGAEMEADLWREIGAVYHAGMRNMCGPYFRAYGMDMTRYHALGGLCIALAVGDSSIAPVPDPRARKRGEWTYAPVFALLGCRVPAEVIPRLTSFTGGRREREVRFRRSRATMLLDERVMMGAARMARRWEQLCPATIHWLAGSADDGSARVGWILLHGENENLDPEISGGALCIRRTAPSKEPVVFIVQCPGLEKGVISPDHWSLPGLAVDVARGEGVTLAGAKQIEHKWYGPCLEVRYAVPGKAAGAAPVITLTPRTGGG